jgi:hypothetical protein
MIWLNSSSSKIIAPKGSGNLFNVVKDDKAGLTVMCTIWADGSVFKPFIIYPHERLPESIKSTFPPKEANLEATKNGWQDSSCFCRYLEVIAQEATEIDLKFPTTLEAHEMAKMLGKEFIEARNSEKKNRKRRRNQVVSWERKLIFTELFLIELWRNKLNLFNDEYLVSTWIYFSTKITNIWNSSR